MRSPQAVEAVTNAAQNAEKEENKNLPESVTNEWVDIYFLTCPAFAASPRLRGELVPD
jgi:hypothetical protein